MSDAFDQLDLPANATVEEIMRARRDLAKRLHPDVGGDAAAMQAVNAAVSAALDRARAASSEPIPDPTVLDAPSFVVEALPAETFEALIVVAATIGEIVDDDPPYVLEVRLRDPAPAWCRLEVVPDAGSSTVSVALSPTGERLVPDVEAVRDRWIVELNQLDWDRF